MIANAFRNTDGAAIGNGLSVPASTALTNINAGTFWAWVKPDSVANTARNIVSKNVAGGGWEMFKRAADGTSLNFTRYRTAANHHTIVSPTGVLKANVPTFIAVSWDVSTSGNMKMWSGTLDAPAALLASTNTLGSGTGSTDAAVGVVFGNTQSGGSQGWPGCIYAAGLSTKVDYTLDEIRRVQFNPLTFRNALGLWLFNAVPVVDVSGNGNTGALLGTGRLSNDCLPRVLTRMT